MVLWFVLNPGIFPESIVSELRNTMLKVYLTRWTGVSQERGLPRNNYLLFVSPPNELPNETMRSKTEEILQQKKLRLVVQQSTLEAILNIQFITNPRLDNPFIFRFYVAEPKNYLSQQRISFFNYLDLIIRCHLSPFILICASSWA